MENSDNAVWVVQSRQFNPKTITPLFKQMLYMTIPVSVCIILASAAQYGRVFKSVRICIDCAALSSLLLSILLLVAVNNPTPTKTAVVRDFLCYGVFQTIVLLCDNYMFYKSYAAVVKVQPWKRNLIHIYVWIILILTWLPKWTILPFFTTDENPQYVEAYDILDRISYYGNIVYNFYFTVQFIRVLVIITHNISNSTSKRSNDRTKILIIKGMGHCITSSLAALLRTSNTTQTANFPIWIFMLLVGLQLWFNSRIECLFYICPMITASLCPQRARIHAEKNEVIRFHDEDVEKQTIRGGFLSSIFRRIFINTNTYNRSSMTDTRMPASTGHTMYRSHTDSWLLVAIALTTHINESIMGWGGVGLGWVSINCPSTVQYSHHPLRDGMGYIESITSTLPCQSCT